MNKIFLSFVIFSFLLINNAFCMNGEDEISINHIAIQINVPSHSNQSTQFEISDVEEEVIFSKRFERVAIVTTAFAIGMGSGLFVQSIIENYEIDNDRSLGLYFVGGSLSTLSSLLLGYYCKKYFRN